MPEPPKREGPTQEDDSTSGSAAGGGGNSAIAGSISQDTERRKSPSMSPQVSAEGSGELARQVKNNEMSVSNQPSVKDSIESRREADLRLAQMKQKATQQDKGDSIER